MNLWRDKFVWVCYEEGVMFCSVCRGQHNLADYYVRLGLVDMAKKVIMIKTYQIADHMTLIPD